MEEQGYYLDEVVDTNAIECWSCYGINTYGDTSFYDSYFERECGEDITDKFRNYLDNDKGVVEDATNTKTFTKSDLKDGMVVSYRESFSGDNFKRVVFKGGLYRVSSDGMSMSHGACLKYYSDTLKYDNDEDMDIMKVEYIGEILWEREEESEEDKKIRKFATLLQDTLDELGDLDLKIDIDKARKVYEELNKSL